MANTKTKKTQVPRPDALSFVSKNKGKGGGYFYFDAKPTGSYALDCVKGERLGAEYLAFIGKNPTNGNRSLLQMIVIDIMEKQTTRGLIVGFMGRVNAAAMSIATDAVQAGERKAVLGKLFADYRAAYKAFSDAAEQPNRRAARNAAKREVKAIQAICSHRCLSQEEERERAAFIIDHIPGYEDMIDISIVDVLLHTLAGRKAVQ